MSRRALSFAVLLLVIGAGFYLWRQSHAGRNTDSGDVSVLADDGSVTTPDGTPVQATPSRSDSGPNSTAPSRQPGTAAPATPSQTSSVSDSVPPNPQDGMKFAGTGRYQVYRQGNLTWRLDTDTGHTCILFATEEEWRKPIVYTHGCNSR